MFRKDQFEEKLGGKRESAKGKTFSEVACTRSAELEHVARRIHS